MIILTFALPKLEENKPSLKEKLGTFDGIGAVLSVAWPIPFLFALQQGGLKYAWDSGVIIGTLTTGIAVFIAFMVYETWVQRQGKDSPIFPVRFLTDGMVSLILLCV